jgi:hypothetical protein
MYEKLSGVMAAIFVNAYLKECIIGSSWKLCEILMLVARKNRMKEKCKSVSYN